MAMIALEEVLAVFRAKDHASKELKRLKNETSRTTKELGEAEKQSSRTRKAVDRLGMSFGKLRSRMSKPGKKVGEKTGGVATTVAGGGAGGLVSALGTSLPFGIGALIAAPILAMRQSVQKFVQGVQLQSTVLKIQNDFSQSFSKKLRESLEQVDGFFERDDLRQAFSALAGRGIDPKQIEKSSRVLAEFTKAQGLTSMTEGLQALTSGQIQYGRGLDETSIRQIQALVPHIQEGGQAAEIAFAQVTAILERNQKSMETNARETEKNLGAIQAAQNQIIRINRDIVTDSVETTKDLNEGLRSLEASKYVEKQVSTVVDQLGKATGKAVGELTDVAGEALPTTKLPGRAGGGVVSKNKPVIVGERNPEIFIPPMSGKILNPERGSPGNSGVSRAGGTTINNYNTVTVTIAGSGNSVSDVRRGVMDALESLAKTTYRQSSGLPMRG